MSRQSHVPRGRHEPEQHSAPVEQGPSVPAQHLPATQRSVRLQQSPKLAQEAPFALQSHMPPVQLPLQQSAAEPHDRPLRRQHLPARQSAPPQHSNTPVHGLPSSAQQLVPLHMRPAQHGSPDAQVRPIG